ncbi:hypothetical protein Mal15_00640 [Stieleria maiorica]|uniref:Carbonic anhydrase n=1 Tax=Stieleria maiorica TaxID=2795974 RepID=A0A5B9M491_9BACT|nr:hypothetical protein [Stieleria maiorica]QEF96038.1 hypothetical protein Mal15_00640 [Stieleria maiorica]
MSLLANAPSTSKAPYYTGGSVKCLQDALIDASKTVDWLIISHDDPKVHDRIMRVPGSQSSCLLTVPQFQWNFQTGELVSLLERAIDRSGVQRLLLVGHSDSPVDDSESSFQRTKTPRRLFDATRSMLTRAQHAKNDFADRVNSISLHPTVHRGLAGGQLRVHALFYLAHSEAFLLFDPSTNEFRPLA